MRLHGYRSPLLAAMALLAIGCAGEADREGNIDGTTEGNIDNGTRRTDTLGGAGTGSPDGPTGSICRASNGGATVEIEGLRITPALQNGTGAAYATIRVLAGTDTLLGFCSDGVPCIAGQVELHRMRKVDGMMRMEPVELPLAITPDAPIELRPGGNHIMLIGVTNELRAGDTASLVFQFAKAKGIGCRAVVR